MVSSVCLIDWFLSFPLDFIHFRGHFNLWRIYLRVGFSVITTNRLVANGTVTLAHANISIPNMKTLLAPTTPLSISTEFWLYIVASRAIIRLSISRHRNFEPENHQGSHKTEQVQLRIHFCSIWLNSMLTDSDCTCQWLGSQGKDCLQAYKCCMINSSGY